MARKQQEGGPSGLVVLDKPAGFTSHDVVARMRRVAGTRRVGHGGTLDPMATGVLIVGVNKATKLLTWISGESKTYEATIRLGASTVTDDAEGEVLERASAAALEAVSEEAIRAGIRSLTGEILQVPSAVSAIKVGGVRSYARVRSGQDVELAARPVSIGEFALHAIRRVADAGEAGSGGQAAGAGDAGAHEAGPGGPGFDLDVTVSCSSGTYIRALARDLGRELGVGGHLTALRRTRIGEVGLEDASTLEELGAAAEAGRPLPLLPLETAARRLFAVRGLTAQEATDLSNGRWIAPSAAPGGSGDEEASGSAPERDAAPAAPAAPEAAGPAREKDDGVVPASRLTACYAPDGRLVALAQDQHRRGRHVAVPHLVFESGQRFGAEGTAS
ncbi:tRNA pseudouridine(55) synthase TruB [Rothia halotolerans]|uniref:tRNA pseudouridine(55) synthase TruB n=1 Tax=Rothia halotolerans TaxID=405770 RepID=UPI00101C3F96|nr:tRNA pseudouridine(55) synthase TruB [Rothia halotolerans]